MRTRLIVMNKAATIGLVDDDPAILRALQRLLVEEGLQVLPHASAEAFIRSGDASRIDCLVLDVSMPGLDGLGLQAHLTSAGVKVPIIFLTGAGDIPTSVRAIKAGAVDFLTKPFSDADLLAGIHSGIDQYARDKEQLRQRNAERARLDKLTQREHEVLRHVISGRLNKQIASELGISEQTIKVHRMHITEKLEVRSVAELVRTAAQLGVVPVTREEKAQ
jgi:FixJ family two-component response regulator